MSEQPDKEIMDTATSLASLYKILEELSGPIKAKNTVVSILSIVISELQSEGLPISPENIQIHLEKYAIDFQTAKKSAA